MNGLKELFRRYSEPVSKVPLSQIIPDIPPLIDPATGEEKKRLEAECEKYFQDPDKTTVHDFLNFTYNMRKLIGEKRHETVNGIAVTVSNPLLDQKTQTSIEFRVITQEKARETVVTMHVGHPDQLGGLSVYHYFTPIECSRPYTMPEDFFTTILSVNSYISGKEESEMIVYESNIELNPDKAKDLARKVWDVYLQGQQVRTPTPQNQSTLIPLPL